jgi:hypothetical protein
MARGTGAGLGNIAAKQSAQAEIQATNDERKAFGLGGIVGTPSIDEEPIYVVLKYYDSEHECFSSWQRDELTEFSGFINKLRQQTWNNVASGIRPKPCDPKLAKNGARDRLKRVHDLLSKDIQFIEMRVTRRARVHGFRMKNAFFLVLLDRDHQTFPE